MSQNVKNTLYRFKTMRAPELIGDEQKENHFVTRPVGAKSKFAGTTIGNKDFTEKAEGHQLLHDDLESLKLGFGTFYKFATWLTKNRTSVTKDSANDAFGSVRKYTTGVDTAVIESLWNDLHFLAFQNSNSYLRDAIISILVADAFYRKVIDDKGHDFDDAAIQRVAQARIILDVNLPQDNGSTTPKTVEPNYRNELEKAKRFLDSKNQMEDEQTFLSILTELEKTYQRKLAVSKAAYDKEYQTLVDEAYANATLVERVVTDKETGETSVVEEYENLNLPKYDFQPQPELEIDAKDKPSFLSDGDVAYLEDLKRDYGYATFQEVKDYTQQKHDDAQSINLKNAPQPEKQVVYKGIALPKTTSAIKPTSLELCFHKIIRTQFNYRVAFRIGTPNTSYVVSDMSYALKFQDGTENANGVYNLITHPITGVTILIADLYPSNNVLIDRPVDTFECTVNFTNGESFSFAHQFDASGDVANAGCPQVAVTWFDKDDNDGTDPVNPKPPTEQPIIYGLQRVGIADYRKVEQEVCCYVPGEVSHIENIMAREYKSKTNTRRKLNESVISQSAETESEKLTDTTSTDRFEMNQEIASLVAQDQSISASVGTQFDSGGDMGAPRWGVNANASFANNTSTEESNSQAITHAQELTERALDRVVQKVKEERVEKIVEEYTEENTHGFDNREGDSHISGVYRWVDKIYKNQIHNYGKRLMYEFMVPEPASFHNLAATITLGNGDGEELTKPVDPRSANAPSAYRINSPTNIKATNAKYWAGIYNVEIEAMPEDIVKLTSSHSEHINSWGAEGWNSRSFSGDENSGLKASGDSKYYDIRNKAGIELPEDYVCKRADIIYSYNREGSRGNGHGNFQVEKQSRSLIQTTRATGQTLSFTNLNTSKNLSFSLLAHNIHWLTFNIVLECYLTDSAKEQWRIKTFNAIIEAYEDAKAAYDEKLAALDTETTKQLEVNPGFYRKIENDVLRKNCIAYLIGHSNLGKTMITGAGVTGITPIQNQSLNDYAETVKFFEQAFEWNIMSYYFYPFYWGEKSTWAKKYQVENNDPLFRAFLQSGMARVIVTVRPGFEEAVNWYLATGQIWNGGQVPTVDDKEFISIIEELQEPESVVEETWETRVPTSLTVIQAGSIGLNVEGLPCNTDCEMPGLFDSDQNPIVQTNAQLGVEGNQRLIEFTWQRMDGGNDYFATIGDIDGEGAWPRNYQILNRNISIDRDASWNASDTLEVLYNAIAEELSLTPGLEVLQVTTQTGVDGLRFLVDVNTIPLLSFVKASENVEPDDKLSVAVNNDTVTLTNGMYFSERFLDKNGENFSQDDHNTALAISRFLV